MLSKNWADCPTGAGFYVETFRNIPLLLQIFWWFRVLRSMPAPRLSYSLGDVVFLNIRGLYLPAPRLNLSWLGDRRFGIAVFLTLVLVRWRGSGRRRLGRQFPVVSAALALLLCLPLLTFWLAGSPLHWQLQSYRVSPFEAAGC